MRVDCVMLLVRAHQAGLAVSAELDRLVADLAAESRSGDHILIMSNGDFGGLHGRLLSALENAASERALP